MMPPAGEEFSRVDTFSLSRPSMNEESRGHRDGNANQNNVYGKLDGNDGYVDRLFGHCG